MYSFDGYGVAFRFYGPVRGAEEVHCHGSGGRETETFDMLLYHEIKRHLKPCIPPSPHPAQSNKLNPSPLEIVLMLILPGPSVGCLHRLDIGPPKRSLRARRSRATLKHLALAAHLPHHNAGHRPHGRRTRIRARKIPTRLHRPVRRTSLEHWRGIVFPRHATWVTSDSGQPRGMDVEGAAAAAAAADG